MFWLQESTLKQFPKHLLMQLNSYFLYWSLIKMYCFFNWWCCIYSKSSGFFRNIIFSNDSHDLHGLCVTSCLWIHTRKLSWRRQYYQLWQGNIKQITVTGSCISHCITRGATSSRASQNPLGDLANCSTLLQKQFRV